MNNPFVNISNNVQANIDKTVDPYSNLNWIQRQQLYVIDKVNYDRKQLLQISTEEKLKQFEQETFEYFLNN